MEIKKAKKQTKDEKITVRCTTEDKKSLEARAAQYNLNSSTYAYDLIFNGSERRKSKKRATCTTLVKANHSLDKIYDYVSGAEGDTITVSELLPILDNAREELKNLWHR